MRLSNVSIDNPVILVPFTTDDVSVDEETDPIAESTGEEASEVEGVEGVDPDTGGYRGVPPKRYTPERINRKARYSVVCLVTSHLIRNGPSF